MACNARIAPVNRTFATTSTSCQAAGMGIDSIEFREHVFETLRVMLKDTGGFLSRRELEAFEVDGVGLPLLDGQQAIHNPTNPVALDATLSVYSKPGSKYDDGASSEGIWRYGYTGDNPGGRNKKLREAYRRGLPIIYYDWIADGVYAPMFPVFVIDDVPSELHVVLAYDSLKALGSPESDTQLEAAYRQAVVQQRIHQREFRARVLYAYRTACAICEMPYASLLDAAHIRPYGEPGGERDVKNGLALCSIHHRAYDKKLLGIDGEHRLYVRPEVQAIDDGPVLAASLQSLSGTRMSNVPRGRAAPDPDRLEVTFKEFLDSLPSK
jgi:putative restriction endonuclease